MILCLVVAHASIFITPRQAIFCFIQRVNLFCVIGKFLSENIFGNFPFDFSSSINTNFNVRNS